MVNGPPAEELPPPAPEPLGFPGDPAVPPPPAEPAVVDPFAAPAPFDPFAPPGRFPRAPLQVRIRPRSSADPPFVPPTFNPLNGSMVGVAKPIYINFARPIANRALAESAVHISSVPPVPGKFYWMSDTQLRWRPIDFWPANTNVFIDAAGTKSSFHTGDSLVATVDNTTHQMTVIAKRQGGEDVPGLDGQDRDTTPPTAPTTCSSGSRAS